MPTRLPSVESKRRERDELNKLVSEFQAKGGKISSQSPQPYKKPAPPLQLRNPDDAGKKFPLGHYKRKNPKYERRVPKPPSVIAHDLRRTREPKRGRPPTINPNPEWARQQELKRLLLLQESGITYPEFRWAMNYGRDTHVSFPTIARKLKLKLVHQAWDQTCDAFRFWFEEMQLK
jgi:hypothetical protein